MNMISFLLTYTGITKTEIDSLPFHELQVLAHKVQELKKMEVQQLVGDEKDGSA